MNDETPTTRERRWVRGRTHRRVAPPLWPFVWRGLLPALGLLLLALYGTTRFASHWIEAEVVQNVSVALSGSGHEWANVQVSGQQALLTGPAPNATAAEQALQVARAATCPTWLGPKVCAISVDGDFASAPAAPPAPTESQAAARCEATVAELLASARIEFASGSATLVAATEPLLDRIGSVVAGCPGAVRIEGHTDSTGDAEANRALSAARAEAVRVALVSRGIPADRLTAEGFGQTTPIAGNDSASGRARNRRIEFRFQTPN